MITLASLPKAFEGHIGIIQRNALESWARLDPRPRVVLLGDDPGVAEAAASRGVEHVPEVARNAAGTPLLNGVLAAAERVAGGGTLIYVNADIILISDFMPAVAELSALRRSFLMVGRRWDLDVVQPIEFSPRWQEELSDRARREGRLHAASGIDYFVFPSGLFGEVPPFAVGRTAWDNWLLYRACSRGARLIDASERVTAVHQNHAYPGGKESVWTGPEATENRALGGEPELAFTIEDATHRLTRRGLRSTLLSPPYSRRLFVMGLVSRRWGWLTRGLKQVLDVTYPLRRRLHLAHLRESRCRR